jgi:hypothetical protein
MALLIVAVPIGVNVRQLAAYATRFPRTWS